MNAIARGPFPCGPRKDETMTAKRLAALFAAGAVLALGACATPEPPALVTLPPPPPPPHAAPPGPSRVAPPAPISQPVRPTTAANAKPPHRQYLDQRSGRYYYFDPTTHRYLWEDGTPRY
jgi:hypothetical protein